MDPFDGCVLIFDLGLSSGQGVSQLSRKWVLGDVFGDLWRLVEVQKKVNFIICVFGSESKNRILGEQLKMTYGTAVAGRKCRKKLFAASLTYFRANHWFDA